MSSLHNNLFKQYFFCCNILKEMEVWLRDISLEFYPQLRREPIKCLGSAIVILSFLQQLKLIRMDTMEINLGMFLEIVADTDVKKGKQHLDVLIQDEKSRLKAIY